LTERAKSLLIEDLPEGEYHFELYTDGITIGKEDQNGKNAASLISELGASIFTVKI
jgi:hypothetical protein